MSKKITFISNINHNGDTQEISFEAAVDITSYEGFTVYEFKEPNMNVMNRIEIAPDYANIFAGPSTINLELNKTIAIQYETPQGILLLDSHLEEMDCSDENNVKFQYTLSQQDQIVGRYNIELKIEG